MASSPVRAAEAASPWVSAWATALQPIPQRSNLPPLYQAPDVAGRTVRQIVYPSLSGHGARIRLSNEYGKTPLVIQAARLDRSAGGAAIRADGGAPITFGGSPSVTVPPGGEAESDPIAVDIERGVPYAISTYAGPEQRLVAWHRVASQVNYVSTPGDHTAEPAGGVWRRRFTQYVWVTELVVEAAPARAVAAIGDSITDGMRSSLDQNRRWPDALVRRLAQAGESNTAVLDLGISGNRLLSDSPCYGDALARRFDHDVLRQAGVKTAILLIGINDINFPSMPSRTGLDCDSPHTVVTARSLIEGYRRVIAMAHQHGVKILGGTLTPASLPPQREHIRLEVNRWIRTSGAFDAVIDFDDKLRDPAAPDRLQKQYDSGDHIHPDDAGYVAMAEAVPLKALLPSASRK